MLPVVDLRRLSRWCSSQGFSWTPARSSDGAPAVMLARTDGRHVACMMLVVGAEDWRLLDEREEVVAAASSLDLLLDAADGGSGDGAAPYRLSRAPRSAAAPADGREGW